MLTVVFLNCEIRFYFPPLHYLCFSKVLQWTYIKMFSIKDKKKIVGKTETDHIIYLLGRRARKGLGRESMEAKEPVKWHLQQDTESFIQWPLQATLAGRGRHLPGKAGTDRRGWCSRDHNFHHSFFTRMLDAWHASQWRYQHDQDTFLSSKNVHSIDGRQKNKLPSGMQSGICGCIEC